GKIELLVSTRNGRPYCSSAETNSAAPGSAASSWTSTPSMSVSQEWIGWSSSVAVMAPVCRLRPADREHAHRPTGTARPPRDAGTGPFLGTLRDQLPVSLARRAARASSEARVPSSEELDW